MKKLIAITIMGLLALSQGQASMMNLNSTARNITFVDEAGGALLTSDGWLVTFWWSQSGADGTWLATGLSGFLDYGDPGEWTDRDGQFFFSSLHSFTGTPMVEAHLAIGIMQVPDSVLNGLTFGDDAEAIVVSTTGVGRDTIESLWSTYGDEANWFTGSGNAASGGSISGANLLPDWFGFPRDGKVTVTGDVIPEPSTWLLLGAGAAFTVIMRRRKK